MHGGHPARSCPGSAPCPSDFAPEVKVKGTLLGDTKAATAWPGGEFGPQVKGEGRAIIAGLLPGQAPFCTVYFFVND